MKNMEKKIAAQIVKNGEAIKDITVVCHGNASYRVWNGNTCVQVVFGSDADATNYAIEIARLDISVLSGVAKIKTF